MDGYSSRHEYRGEFFDYINAGSLASAAVICPLLISWLGPTRLLDVGCGAGAWCKVWAESGVADVVGVDGQYVLDESLLIPKGSFHRTDLSARFDLERKFDLVTSLEVAEHVPEGSAGTFVENIARHGDCVLFSAAVPGQGGEFHVNEQPLQYWRERFEALGYQCFDPVRPVILKNPAVEPWYRYNTLLYARGDSLGMLPEAVRKTHVGRGTELSDLAPVTWRLRNAIIRTLPEPIVDGLVTLKHSASRRFRRS